MRGIWARVGVAALAATLFIPVIGISSAHALGGPCDPPSNPIVCENSKPGVPPSYWQVQGAGDPGLQGFGTQISVNHGDTIGFKVTVGRRRGTSTSSVSVGTGQRRAPDRVRASRRSAPQPQDQPPCLTDTEHRPRRLRQLGVSAASCQVPADAVSGVYIALMTRDDTGGQSHIVFVVRDDSQPLRRWSSRPPTPRGRRTTPYGGFSLYQGPNAAHRAYKVSYNRPFITVSERLPQLVDQRRAAHVAVPRAQRLRHLVHLRRRHRPQRRAADEPPDLRRRRVTTSTGRAPQRANVDAARDAGVNIAFVLRQHRVLEDALRAEHRRHATRRTARSSRTRSRSTTRSPIPRRRPGPVCGATRGSARPRTAAAPRTRCSARSARSSVVQDTMHGRRRPTPAAALAQHRDREHGAGHDPLAHRSARSVTSSTPTSTTASNPPGLIRASTTTLTEPSVIQDFSQTTGAGHGHPPPHRVPRPERRAGVRRGHGQLVVHADGQQERRPGRPERAAGDGQRLRRHGRAAGDARRRRSRPRPQSTDTTAPTSTITSPVARHGPRRRAPPSRSPAPRPTPGGGVVAGVEVSTDGGTTWHPATGRYAVELHVDGRRQRPGQRQTRAVDDSGNLETPSRGSHVTVNCPCTPVLDRRPRRLPPRTTARRSRSAPGSTPTTNGYISGVRFYKGTTNTGVHIGNLWTTSGTLLATATFTNESASGWQQVNFSSAGRGHREHRLRRLVPHERRPLRRRPAVLLHERRRRAAPRARELGDHARTACTRTAPTSTFPTSTSGASNYWVDVVFTTDAAPAERPLDDALERRDRDRAERHRSARRSPSPSRARRSRSCVKDPDNATVPGTLSVQLGDEHRVR